MDFSECVNVNVNAFFSGLKRVFPCAVVHGPLSALVLCLCFVQAHCGWRENKMINSLTLESAYGEETNGRRKLLLVCSMVPSAQQQRRSENGRILWLSLLTRCQKSSERLNLHGQGIAAPSSSSTKERKRMALQWSFEKSMEQRWEAGGYFWIWIFHRGQCNVKQVRGGRETRESDTVTVAVAARYYSMPDHTTSYCSITYNNIT